MSPSRIQRKRTPGWRLPESAVIVDRTSSFGNPFLVDHTKIRIPATDGTDWEIEGRSGKTPGERHPYRHPDGTTTWHLVEAIPNREQAADWYRRWLSGGGPAGIWTRRKTFWRRQVIDGLPLLAGKDLACPCPLPEPGEQDHCHATVLLALANPERPQLG